MNLGTQQGNNNAYCQDDDSWVNWDIGEAGASLIEFVRKLTTLRNTLPVLRRGRFLIGELDNDVRVSDVKWLGCSGEELTSAHWDDSTMRCFGLVIDGRARATGIRRAASDATVLIVVNAHHDLVGFILPDIPGIDIWTCLIDTNAPIREEVPTFRSGDVYQVTGRSLLRFSLQARGETKGVLDSLEDSMVDGSRLKDPEVATQTSPK